MVQVEIYEYYKTQGGRWISPKEIHRVLRDKYSVAQIYFGCARLSDFKILKRRYDVERGVLYKYVGKERTS